MDTQELKKKIFSRYVGQCLRAGITSTAELTIGKTDSNHIDLTYSLTHFESHVLQLKSLHDITDEDAIKVASITMRKHNSHYKPEEISYEITHRNTKDQVFAIEINTLVNGWAKYRNRLESKDIRTTDVVFRSGNNVNPGKEYPSTNQIEVFQFLESQGYALPYMEYSVNDLIELNIIELI